MDRAEVEAALAVDHMMSHAYLMVGVLMSSKTLRGEEPKKPGRYPRRERVEQIFSDHPRAINLIHFATDSLPRLKEELLEAMRWGGKHVHGIQINVAWPSKSVVAALHEAHPDAFIVLQVGSSALRLGGGPRQVADWVAQYLPMVNAVLIDPSGGHGTPFEGEEVASYLRAIRDEGLQVSLGFAGGLSGETFEPAIPLLRSFPGVSIDAEGRLRTPPPEDKLSLAEVESYLSAYYAAYRQIRGGYTWTPKKSSK